MAHDRALPQADEHSLDPVFVRNGIDEDSQSKAKSDGIQAVHLL